jgi:hypothetical protein
MDPSILFEKLTSIQNHYLGQVKVLERVLLALLHLPIIANRKDSTEYQSSTARVSLLLASLHLHIDANGNDSTEHQFSIARAS